MAIKIKNKGSKRPDDEPEDQQDQPGQPGVPAGDAPGSGLDAFERFNIKAVSWIENNRGLFFAMLGMAFVAVLGAVAGIVYVNSQQVAASDRLSEGLAAHEQVVEGSPDLDDLRGHEDLAAPDDADVHGSLEERWQAVYDSADHTLEDFDGGPIADSARLSRAAAAMNLGEYEQAEQDYRAVSESGDVSESLRAKAYVGLAYSLAVQSELDDAEQAWTQFAELKPDRQAYAHFEMARLVERYGEPEDAAERYAEFLEQFGDSEYASEVERRKALL